MQPPLICTPLRTETAALRGPLKPASHFRSGAGPERSRNFARRHADHAGLLVAGVGGSVVDHVRPGDVVVASEIRAAGREPLPCRASAGLVDALRATGLRVHVGPLLSTSTLVRGNDRPTLAAQGNLAVDTESWWLGEPYRDRPLAAIRAIVDAPGAPLLSPGTIWRGINGLRTLRRTAPALAVWAAAVVR